MNPRQLSYYIKSLGMTQKEYYDKYLKKDYEDVCEVCGEPSIFLEIKRGFKYSKTCSNSCRMKLKWQNENYRSKVVTGIRNSMKRKDVINRKSIIMTERNKKNWRDPKYKKRMKKILLNFGFTEQWKNEITALRLIKKITSSKNYTHGYYISNKAGKIYYRSSYELDAYNYLDNHDSVKSYITEPLKIRYIFEEKDRSYIPDILIIWKDGGKTLVEVKPESLIDTCVLAKAKAAIHHCWKIGYGFEIWTPFPNKKYIYIEDKESLKR